VRSNFLLKLLIFSLPLAAALGWIEYRVRQNPLGYTYVEDLLATRNAEARLIFTGDSQALYDFKPDEYQAPGINISNVSQSLPITRQILEKNISRLPCASVVVLGLSYFGLEYQLYGQVDDERNFLHTQINAVAGDGGWPSWFDLRRYSRLLTLGPRKSWRGAFKEYASRIPEGYDSFGWYDGEKSSVASRNTSEAAGRGRASYHTSTMVPDLAAKNLAEIENLRILLAKNGMELLLVRLPAMPAYYRHLDPHALQRNEEHDKQLNAPVLNLLKDPRLTPEDFINTDHLNARGAKKLAGILNDVIMKKYDVFHRCPR
jgi:hypothetical protein